MIEEKYYAAIEKAVMDDKQIILPNGEGLRLIMVSQTKLIAEGLHWMDKQRNIYVPMLEVQFRSKFGVPGIYVVGSVALDGFSSGDISMFRKEKRYQSII